MTPPAQETAQKIVPHLWFDQEALEAVHFYTSLFPQSAVTHVVTLRDTPSGDCDAVSFQLWGQRFEAINAGPLFRFNPSISFMVNFDPLFFGPSSAQTASHGESPKEAAKARLLATWEELSAGGTVLIPLDRYPFSECYGWVQDRYGLSWQLILTDPEGSPRPPIVPSLLFTGANYGQAEEAMDFYRSIFPDSRQGSLVRYGPGQEPNREGTVMFADFMLAGSWFAAMDSAEDHGFTFNEAISFMVYCQDQAEIDHYWERLSAVPEVEQCGWLKDRYGLSWQIVPTAMDRMMQDPDPEKLARVTQAFLAMKKLDIAALEKAYRGA